MRKDEAELLRAIEERTGISLQGNSLERVVRVKVLKSQWKYGKNEKLRGCPDPYTIEIFRNHALYATWEGDEMKYSELPLGLRKAILGSIQDGRITSGES
jgi:hypothetical protein